MPEQTQILHAAVTDAPDDYTLADNVEFRLFTVNAEFTDNGAGTAWLPAVVLISDSNHVIARALDQGVQVAAGGSAEVSWFPGGGLAGVGIRYDVENRGEWLYVETTGTGGPDGDGITLQADTGQIELVTRGGALSDINMIPDGDYTVTPNGGVAYTGPSGHQWIAQSFGGYVFLSFVAGSGFTVAVDEPITLEATGGTTSATVNVRIEDGNYFSVFKPDLTKEWVRVGSAGIFMYHLPTVNPGVAGQLWRNGNTVMIV